MISFPLYDHAQINRRLYSIKAKFGYAPDLEETTFATLLYDTAMLSKDLQKQVEISKIAAQRRQAELARLNRPPRVPLNRGYRVARRKRK